MRLWFAAEEESRFKISGRFARWWQVLGFTVIAMFLLFFFFPKEQLLYNIAQQRQADTIARQYLHNLVSLYPAEKSYNLLLIEQKLKAGELDEAINAVMDLVVAKPRTKADWKALTLYYKILRIETYAQPEVSYGRKQGMRKMRELVSILKNGKLDAEDLLEIGDDLVKMNDPRSALQVYQRLLSMRDQKCSYNCAKLYAAAGRFMLAYRNYRGSANFYFLAQNNAETLENKRNYFIAALKSLQAGDLVELAATEGSKHIGELSNDRQTLIFLSRLALAANKPALANNYVKRIIQLKVHSTRE